MTMRAGAVGALVDSRIGITSSRRGDELAALLERRGARVEAAAALAITPCPDDAALRAVTARCIERPPEMLIATTGLGMSGWLEAAAEWGRRRELVASLRRAEIFARGPRSVAALRSAGLRETWASDSEAMEDVLAHLGGRQLHGRRIIVQEHSSSAPGLTATLRSRGGHVSTATVHRFTVAPDREPLYRMVGLVADRELDAITFTSAPAARVLLEVAADTGRHGDFLTALRRDVVTACIGPVTAEVFDAWGVPTVRPARARLAELVAGLDDALATRRQGTRLVVADHELVLRGEQVLLDGVEVRLTPGPRAMLRALARRPGHVLSRAELLAMLPGDGLRAEHAVEATVARLRRAIGPGLVRTVTKRGYRLAVPL